MTCMNKFTGYLRLLQALPCRDWESDEDGKIMHFFGVASYSLLHNYQCFEELTGSIYRA